MEKDIIEIKNLKYMYESLDGNEDIVAIDNLNISVKEGEFVAILGHNGSGKSTLAKLINGLLQPSSGHIKVDGMDTQDEESIWKIREKAGMVFQNPDNQLVATIVEEDVAFGPENLGIPSLEIQKRVDRALRLVEMEEYRIHSPHLLSGGQKQRIAIAGILAMEPECIIMDEPTAMLDPTGRDEVMKTITRLNKKENKTIILITHFMEEAVLADRVIIMEKGRIALEGTPREVFVEVDKIKKLGLDVPQVTELAYNLRREGYDIRKDVLYINELVEEL